MERRDDDRLFGLVLIVPIYAALLVAAFQFLSLPSVESRIFLVSLLGLSLGALTLTPDDVSTAHLPVRYWVGLILSVTTVSLVLGKLAAGLGIEADVALNERYILDGITLGTAWGVSTPAVMLLAKKRGALVREDRRDWPQANRPLLFDVPWRRRRHPR